MFLGLAYLHKSNIPVILSSEKIFLNEQGEVKLAYFHMSKLLKKSKKITSSGVHAHPKVANRTQVPATTVDSYSLGFLLLKICTQQPLSQGVDITDTGARQHEHDLKQLEDTHPFKPIIVWCLQQQYLRPSVDVVYHHVSTVSQKLRLHCVPIAIASCVQWVLYCASQHKCTCRPRSQTILGLGSARLWKGYNPPFWHT